MQCVVMVRDDFWMAVIRFMRELEVRLLDGQNSAAVDLFPIRHAEKVLAAFGRAFGVWPDASTELSKDQKQFLAQAVSGLAQEGKVICVRLALFAEMMKGKTWTPATLKEVGGTEGVGVTFLEETFSPGNGSPRTSLSSEGGTWRSKALCPIPARHQGPHPVICGAARSVGYGNHPDEFDDLVRILDSEIRLITPTDPEGKEEDERRKNEDQVSQAELANSSVAAPGDGRFRLPCAIWSGCPHVGRRGAQGRVPRNAEPQRKLGLAYAMARYGQVVRHAWECLGMVPGRI